MTITAVGTKAEADRVGHPPTPHPHGAGTSTPWSRPLAALGGAVLALSWLAGCGPGPQAQPAQAPSVSPATAAGSQPTATPPTPAGSSTPVGQGTTTSSPVPVTAEPQATGPAPETPSASRAATQPPAATQTCVYTVRDHGLVHAESMQCVSTSGDGIVVVNSAQVVAVQR